MSDAPETRRDADLLRRILERDVSDIERAMMIGLSRSPSPPGNPLDALALLGARLAYERPPPPLATERSSHQFGQPEAYFADASRRMFLTLATGKHADDALAFAAYRAARQTGLAPHPFDYHRIDDFLARHPEALSPAERSWIQAIRPQRANDDQPYAEGPIDETSLPKLSRAQKLAFLRPLRLSDPARARAMIEALVPQESAAIRADLIELLEIKLSQADRACLDAFAQDRASSVRNVAERLLARFPGSPAFAKRIEKLKERVSIETKGLLRKTKSLKFVARQDEPLTAQRALIEGLSLADLAAALGESVETMLAAAEAAEQAGLIPLHMIEQVAREERFDLVERHQSILDDQDADVAIAVLEAVWPSLDAHGRERLLDVAIRPKSWWRRPSLYRMPRVVALLDGPLPAPLAQRWLNQILEEPEGGLGEHDLAAIAPLVPRELSLEFLRRFEERGAKAALYHRFLASLDDTRN